MHLYFFVALFFYGARGTIVNNGRPIIGVLAQELPRSLEAIDPNAESYIAASYVKWVEGAGGRVVPIMINQDQSYYEYIFNSVNGILFPGGGVSLVSSGYGIAGLKLYNLAKAANRNGDFFPLWGTCLGFELMSYMEVERLWLTECDSWNEALHLGVITEEIEESRILSAAPANVLDILSSENVTANFHRKCLTRENMTLSGLDKTYRVLAVNHDSNGLEFISLWEGVSEPFYGVQFHPEKNVFEWTTKYLSIPHSAEAVESGMFFGEFFLSEARKSDHKFPSQEEEQNYLIYNYQKTYVGNKNSTFQEVYFFY
ncbi:gamma-glutamyl hydrolase-like [Artemia franciscana]|uniref:folate gamma-glutamyl hydrolase n=1 Tax=Artemia franciscana TaxID=6661 RepID=A0AA88L392_ARTSF|nr:hypothetical protein QYM36_007393 [Artemia franciscana]